MNTKIQFGRMPPVNIKEKKRIAKSARENVKPTGLEQNGFTTYDHEVRFENIKPTVNVCRVKDDSPDGDIGVAKGAILGNVPITVPTNTSAATMHAMKKRCDFAPRMEDIAAFNRGHEILMAKFEPKPVIRVDQELIQKYLAKCDPAKAERLVEALKGGELGVDGDSKHVFAKQEVLLKDHGAQPRVVYQGTDMYNAVTGPVVMEINDRMKETFSLRNPLNTGNKVIYACGVSGEELGDVMEHAVGEPIESDAKNNDGSQSMEFRKKEAMFYRKQGAPDWFVREFARTTEVRVWTRYGIVARVKGQRWSGETTTTTGNSYVHMCLLQAALERAEIVESTNIHGGDDYLGFIDGDLKQFQAALEDTAKVSGMKAEVVPQPGRHHATFYRKRYIRGSIGCRPVPQFGRVLAKLNLRANRNTQVGDREYMSGKYLSAAYEHRHVPGIRELLLHTSEALSDKPHLDVRQSKIAEMGGADNVTKVIASSPAHDISEFSEFLQQVYGIGFEDLVTVYGRMAQSCVDYCDGWAVAGDKKNQKRKNSRYIPPEISGDVAEALVRLDVG